jgi:hypothetical protein
MQRDRQTLRRLLGMAVMSALIGGVLIGDTSAGAAGSTPAPGASCITG